MKASPKKTQPASTAWDAAIIPCPPCRCIIAAIAYYAQPIVNANWDASPNKVEAIINQKWTALNGYGNIEAYNEYRRTGFPSDVPVSTQSAQANIPTRLFYPLTEYQQNGPNVNAEGTINQFTSKIFWAK